MLPTKSMYPSITTWGTVGCCGGVKLAALRDWSNTACKVVLRWGKHVFQMNVLHSTMALIFIHYNKKLSVVPIIALQISQFSKSDVVLLCISSDICHIEKYSK